MHIRSTLLEITYYEISNMKYIYIHVLKGYFM